MFPRCWLSVILLVLALVAGGAWWLQCQSTAQLRGEIALLQADHGRLVQLRAENTKLAAAQMPAAELTRLRADHAAVVQLRAEIEKLKTGVEQREHASQSSAVAKEPSAKRDPIPVLTVLRAGSWKDAGRATPTAAFETMLWAGSTGNVEALANALMVDTEAGNLAQRRFDAAPAAQQQEYVTPLRMLAALMAKDMPAGDVSVVNVRAPDPASASVVIDAMLRDRDGVASKGKFEFVQVDGHWLLKMPLEAVQHLAGQ